jgi:hypothetical protein
LLQVLVEPTGHLKRAVRTVSVPVMEYSFHRGGLDGQDTQLFFEILLLAWSSIQAFYEIVEFTQTVRTEAVPISYLTNPWNLLDWSRFAILATGVIFRVRMTYDTSRDFDLSTK